MIIKKISESKMQEALNLVWNVFLEYEATDYSEEGVKEFKKSIEDPDWIDAREFYGAFDENNKIIGVIATKDNTHIALFFVDGKFHRQGIGRELFNKVVTCSVNEGIKYNTNFYTVNISDN